jgi:hypothetical protein
MIFEVFMMVTVKVTIFWDVIYCSMLDIRLCFG